MSDQEQVNYQLMELELALETEKDRTTLYVERFTEVLQKNEILELTVKRLQRQNEKLSAFQQPQTADTTKSFPAVVMAPEETPATEGKENGQDTE